MTKVTSGITRWLNTREGRRAQRVIVRIAADEAARRGLIAADATDAELVAGMRTLARQLETTPLKIIIGHETELLQAARAFTRRGEFQLGCLCYATWSEHWLNFTVHYGCSKQRLDRSDIEDLLRSVNVKGKTTWLLRVLRLPALAESHRRAINELAELRNWYVHYKWIPEDVDKPNEQRERIKKIVSTFDVTVRYLQITVGDT